MAILVATPCSKQMLQHIWQGIAQVPRKVRGRRHHAASLLIFHCARKEKICGVKIKNTLAASEPAYTLSIIELTLPMCASPCCIMPLLQFAKLLPLLLPLSPLHLLLLLLLLA